MRTHLVTYSSFSRSDCSCFLVYLFLSTHDTHSDKISVTLSGVIKTVISTVSISKPKHVTLVAGWTTFFLLMSNPISIKRALKASNDALDFLITGFPMTSLI